MPSEDYQYETLLGIASDLWAVRYYASLASGNHLYQ